MPHAGASCAQPLSPDATYSSAHASHFARFLSTCSGKEPRLHPLLYPPPIKNGRGEQKGAETTEPRGKVKNAHSICSAMLIADGGQGGQGGIEESGERG